MARGQLSDGTSRPGVPGERLGDPTPGPDAPPGIYVDDKAVLAVNVLGAQSALATAQWPARITVEGLAVVAETPLKGWLLGRV